MTTALHALLGRHNLKQNGSQSLNLQRPNSGSILVMLLILLALVIYFGAKYSQTLLDRRPKLLELSSEISPIYRKYDPATVVLIAAKLWHPHKTLANQDWDAIYEAAFDSGIWCHTSTPGGAISGIILENPKEDIVAATPSFAPTTSASKAEYAKKDIKFLINEDRIQVGFTKKTAYAIPAQCNLDLVLAIPTNATSALSDVKTASANFILGNFQHIRGVCFSLIPYSGKLSIPSSRTNAWTTTIPAFSASGNTVKLSSLYATTSGNGASLTQAYTWNSTTCPIMHRKNNALCSADNPNSDATKYLKMNLNPCYASPQSSICEKACTNFSANPNQIVEPMLGAADFAQKLNALALPNDSFNKSNFVFMGLEWANNMFQSWSYDPQISAKDGKDALATLGSPSKTTAGRKKAVILVVNAPENFEPAELTYLGFSNDASSVLLQSDVIDFSKQPGNTTLKFADGTPYMHVTAAKQLLRFVSGVNGSAEVARNATTGYYQTTGSSSCYLQMPQRHLVKLVVEKASGNSGTIKFTNITSKNRYLQNNTVYPVYDRCEFFVMQDQISTTKINEQYQLKFEISNIRLISAEMTDRNCTSKDCAASLTVSSDKKTAVIQVQKLRNLTLVAKPVIKSAYVTLNNGTRTEIREKKEVESFIEQTDAIKCVLENATLDGTYLVNQVRTWYEGSLSGWDNSTTFDVNVKRGKLYFKAEADTRPPWSIGSTPYEGVLQRLQIKINNSLVCLLMLTGVGNALYVLPYDIDQYTEYNNGVYSGLISASTTREFNTTSPTTISFEFMVEGTMKDVLLQTTNYDSIPFGSSDFYLGSDNFIHFIGPADLHVVVTPGTLSFTGSIQHSNTNGQIVTENIDGSSNPNVTVNINPVNYAYQRQSDGSYKINLNLTNIESLSNLSLVDNSYIFELADANPPSTTLGNEVLGGSSLQSLTENACGKLREAYSDDVRIYLVKYRKSAGDYGYLDNCATSGGGKVYDVGDSVALKSTLDAIAADIKLWGGYEKARVVN